VSPNTLYTPYVRTCTQLRKTPLNLSCGVHQVSGRELGDPTIGVTGHGDIAQQRSLGDKLRLRSPHA
jgi:hypothetical protein